MVVVVAEAQAVKEDREGDDRVADALSEAKLANIPMRGKLTKEDRPNYRVMRPSG